MDSRTILALYISLLYAAAAAGPAFAVTERSPAACDVVAHGAARPGPDHGDRAAHETPPNPNGPTRVSAGFHALDIRHILPVEGSFQYRGYVRTSWCDPRLAFEGVAPRIYTNQRVEEEFERIWTPQGYPSNALGDLQLTERVLQIYPDGTVLQDINVSMRLATHYDLLHFPFDTQVLPLQVESYLWERDAVEFVIDHSTEGSLENLEMPEWTVESVSATGTLTVVAYQFVFAGDLPRVGYLTILDKVMIGSFGLLAVTVVQSLLVTHTFERSPTAAKRIDRASRWVFPCAYAAIVG